LAAAPGAPAAWRRVLSTDDPAWGGSAAPAADPVEADAAALVVPPLTGTLYRAEPTAGAPRRAAAPGRTGP
ncbi:MAG TPA: DUF4430 domain-containing protein, partial [Gemmatimonadota bacterium]